MIKSLRIEKEKIPLLVLSNGIFKEISIHPNLI